MSLTEQAIQTALQTVVDPNTHKDLVASRSAKNIKIDGADVSLDIELGYPARSQIEPIRQRVGDTIKAVPGVGKVTANVFQKIVSQGISPQLLEWKGIEATEKFATSPNTKIVVIGNPKNGLPIILGGEK